MRVGLSKKSFSCLIRRRWKKDDLAADFIFGMRGSEESKVKPKLWMVEEGVSERFDEISIEGRDSISRADLLKIYEITFWKIEFEEHGIPPWDYFTNTRKNIRYSRSWIVFRKWSKDLRVIRKMLTVKKKMK